MSQNAKHVVIVLYRGVELLDVAGPAEVFAVANFESGLDYYRVHYLCLEPQRWLRASSGLEIRGKSLAAIPKAIDTLLVPGAETPSLLRALEDEKLLRAVDRLAARATRRTSVCSGAFFLGKLGYLDGRRVTTHWAAIRELARRHPAATVVQDSLYQQDGKVWTSAGVLSGVDMTLAMVRKDLGADIALQVARRLVVYLIRDGGQPQFSAPMNLQSRASGLDLGELVSWLEARLSEPVTVAAMAERMAVSVRTLHRRCLDAFDMTPARLLNELRLEHARARLHTPNVPVKRIAYECGFGSQPALSKAFTQRFGVAPSRYRENFRA